MNIICFIFGHDIKVIKHTGLSGVILGKSIYCSRCGYLSPKQQRKQLGIDKDSDGEG